MLLEFAAAIVGSWCHHSHSGATRIDWVATRGHSGVVSGGWHQNSFLVVQQSTLVATKLIWWRQLGSWFHQKRGCCRVDSSQLRCHQSRLRKANGVILQVETRLFGIENHGSESEDDVVGT